MGSVTSSLINKTQSTIASISDKNKESITLIWFDPNIGSRDDTQQTMKRLRQINNYVIFHNKIEPCLALIQSIDREKIFLILSGSQASLLLPAIAQYHHIDSIFIFCIKKDKYEYLLNDYPKIIGIYSDIDSLCTSIQKQTDLVEKQLQTFSIFDRHQKSTRDLSKESAEFLWFQLFNDVVLHLPRNQQAKKEMIDICRRYYHDNDKEQSLIDEFERDYTSDKAIRWYSKQSFVYKLINKALRSEDIDQLHTFRFFIGDLSESLACEHRKLIMLNREILIVYRGVKLSENELEKFKQNQSQLISTNGYLSTSRLREPALAFALKQTKRTDAVPVLFEITCDIEKLDDTLIFADITQLSDYADEQEVLFDIGAAFRVDSIEFNGQLWLIKMIASNEGRTITQGFINETHRDLEEISVGLLFGKLLCDMGQYDKAEKYFQQLLTNPDGEDVAWIEYFIGRVLWKKGEYEKARTYIDYAYNRMIKADVPRIKDLSWVLNHIAIILHEQKRYDEALEYYQKALIYRQESYPENHPSIADTYNNIGMLYRNKCDHNLALEYLGKALEMRKKCLTIDHPAIGNVLVNIGNLYADKNDFENCLQYHLEALIIFKRTLPPTHADIAMNLNNIGVCYEILGKCHMALDYYQRAEGIFEKTLPPQHPERVRNEQNIKIVSEKIK